MKRKVYVVLLLLALSLQFCCLPAAAQTDNITTTDGGIVIPARVIVQLLGHDIPLGIFSQFLGLRVVLSPDIHVISASGVSRLNPILKTTVETILPDNITPGEYNGREGYWNNFGEFIPTQ